MRVGIITFYNGNINYGGILQAYALQKTIENLGYECRQVCLDNTISEKLTLFQKIGTIIKLGTSAIEIYQRKKSQEEKERLLRDIRPRQKAGFIGFEKSIPHTSKSFKPDEMSELDSEFDMFVCGSDQIWTPNSGGFRPVPHKLNYFLAFTQKYKISYAASFGTDRISDKYARLIVPLINDLDAVSVREKNAKKLLERRISKDITVVADPVMLLSSSEWQKIMIKPKESNYVFAYVLGKKDDSRFFIKKCSRELQKLLITVPYIGDYSNSDKDFGDKQCIGITPGEFLGYIQNADYIVTDSFHCAVFCVLLEKQFLVLRRSGDSEKGAMNSRLTDLLKVLSLEDRLIDDSYSNLTAYGKIDYSKTNEMVRKLSRKSIDWLDKNLKRGILK